jgi:hypothetical protein
MPTFQGKFHYSTDPPRDGPCQFTFDGETATFVPAAGTAITFDLGDVDVATRNEWDLELVLFTGRHLTLRQFGPAFDRMAGEFLAAWRERTIRCLMLEDLERVGVFNGTASLGSQTPVGAEIHVFKSNLAVLPTASAPFQWRLAEVDEISFDAERYAVTLRSGGERLTIGKLARKTDEFFGLVQSQFEQIRQKSAEALHRRFPMLDSEQLGQLVETMPEGRSASFARLKPIHSGLIDAILKSAVDESLRPYFEALRAKSNGSLLTGYKFIRQEEGEDGDELFFWFFFPLQGPDGRHSGLAAWEAATGGGRATYLFRTHQKGEAPEHVQEAIHKLTQGLALLSFRREPIYLPEDSLAQNAKFHRYAIGCRKLPVLRELRADFAGRAIHSSIEEWTAQLEKLIAGVTGD